MNPLLERVIQIFDENKDNEIQFTEFIKALAIFSNKGAKEEKLKCPLFLPASISFFFLCLPYSQLLLPFLSPPSLSACPLLPASISALVAFRVYDIDGDNYISNGELFQVPCPIFPRCCEYFSFFSYFLRCSR